MKLSVIAKALSCAISASYADMEIERIDSLEGADEGSVTFLVNEKQRALAEAAGARVFIVKKGKPIDGKINLEVDDPYLGYALVAQLYEEPMYAFDTRIHPSAAIDGTAEVHGSSFIGAGTVIGRRCVVGRDTVIAANCVIEDNCRIGAGCRIDSGAIMRRNTIVGDRVIIQSGTVIGCEGFGNAREGDRFVRIPCFGNVVIEDDVEIGANVTIDRGNFRSTIIRRGSRLDNLIQVAHNVEIGENTAMAAQVGVSGSTKIGDAVLIGGQAGLAGHLEIGDRAFVGAKAGISKDVAPGARVTGYPARDFMRMRRIEAAEMRLPEALKEIKRLRVELEELRAARDAGATAPNAG